jgi:hypothetical protein
MTIQTYMARTNYGWQGPGSQFDEAFLRQEIELVAGIAANVYTRRANGHILKFALPLPLTSSVFAF